MNQIKVTKIFCLDENIRYPKCHNCNKELSPFKINSEELNKCTDKFLSIMITLQYLRLNAIDKDSHLIFLCKHCLANDILIKNK